jgi:uncharacterized membrane-anchored protein YjiN (DUF445 family)
MSLDAPGDAERRTGLRQMRIVATSLLVVAAIIYLLTLGQEPRGFLGFVNTAAEAAMVGALADWFAVTAIFRHPLGIPIPHTALVKRRKNDLGRSLQQFVTANFLTEEVFRRRLEQSDLALRFASWLKLPRHRHRVLTEVINVARLVINRVADDDISKVIEDSVLPRLQKEELAPIAGAFLEGIVEDHSHRGVVDLLVGEVREWLLDHPDEFQALFEGRAPKWSPAWMERMVARYVYDQALEWVGEIAGNPEHRVRLALDDLLATMANDLQHDEEVRTKGEALKDKLLSHPQIPVTVGSLWQSIKASLLDAMDDEESSLWRRCDGWLAEFGARLGADARLRKRLEVRVSDIVAFLINRYGHEVAGVISHTVDSWDATEASKKIELFVGRDLQFIRINGTIVGALAGLVIHTVSVLIVR